MPRVVAVEAGLCLALRMVVEVEVRILAVEQQHRMAKEAVGEEAIDQPN